jgi:Superinfection immunity protein
MRTLGLIGQCTVIIVVGIVVGKNAGGRNLLAEDEIAAAPTRVSFIGCPSDGQVGPAEAPKGKDKSLPIPVEAADKLAYYSSESNLGALAPKGWYCFGTYGSDGSSLYISPHPIDTEQLFSDKWPGFAGPTIQVSWTSGGTSGRFEVARTIARIFPAHQAFSQKVIDEGIEPATSFPTTPYTTDKLRYRNDEIVEYQTPANTDGLGTESRLQKNDDPISGVAIIHGEDTDLLKLNVRLPESQSSLIPIIIQQLEDEMAVGTQVRPKPEYVAEQPPINPTTAATIPLTSTPAKSSHTGNEPIFLIVLIVTFLFLLYWIPTLVAYQRDTVNKGGVLIVNLFFGWTFIGWVTALAMAMGGSVHQKPTEPVVIYAQNIYRSQEHGPSSLSSTKTIEGLPSSERSHGS